MGDEPVGLAAFAGRLHDAADALHTTPVDVPAPGCRAAPGVLGELAGELHRQWAAAVREQSADLSATAVRLSRLGTEIGLAARRYGAVDDGADAALRRAADR
ncbi:hypothetical protein [Actinocatenispora rupis]|uniref:Excreted virulence factor EspC, type VII ESX diderm n=1 Tax=Actinocatenispora rupis TaxID=519421 RepID=A0A8J3NGP0_9ACTN|nr:hypothetical protein [Actinocatenispora rupis]GID15059.1 hypothetical protein Aru02nite_59480 [Actinocatenispora rupis]